MVVISVMGMFVLIMIGVLWLVVSNVVVVSGLMMELSWLMVIVELMLVLCIVVG